MTDSDTPVDSDDRTDGSSRTRDAREVVIFGCGRGADVAYRHLTVDSPHEICGFTVDSEFLDRDTFRDLPVVPFEEITSHFPPERYALFALLGYRRMNHLRAEKFLTGKDLGFTFVSYVSSGLFGVEDLQIGENCFILDNQSINLDVQIGNNVVMWSSNHLGDRTVIGDHVWISSHVTIAADVTVEEHSFVGVGATIANGVRVAPETYVGPNALISSHTKAKGVYAVSETPCSPGDSTTFIRVLEATGKL